MKWAFTLAIVLAVACTVSAKDELTADKIMMEVHKLQKMGKKAGIIEYLDQLYADISGQSQTAEQSFNAFTAEFCNYEEASNTIQGYKDSITQKNQQVLSKTWSMGNVSESTIPPLRASVESFHDPINAKEEQLAGLKQKRDEDHQLFIERRTETLKAIKVIEEIRLFLVNASEVSTQASGSGEGGFTNQQYGALLEAAAREYRGMKGQLMRTAARALTSGAVDSIYEILYKMRNEFKEQLDSLADIEASQYQSWHSERVRLRNEIGQHLIDMESKKQEISNEHTKMANLEAEIAVLNIEMAQDRYNLNAAQMALEDSHKLCTEEQERFVTGKERREAALAAIDTLKGMLTELMQDPDYENLHDAISGSNDTISNVQEYADNITLTGEQIKASGAGAVPYSLEDLSEATPENRETLSSSWSHDDEYPVEEGAQQQVGTGVGGGV